MTTQETIDRAREVLNAHEMVWVGHKEGYDCGCNEYGDRGPWMTTSDALNHQVQMLDDAGLLTDPQALADAWDDGNAVGVDRGQSFALNPYRKEKHK